MPLKSLSTAWKNSGSRLFEFHLLNWEKTKIEIEKKLFLARAQIEINNKSLKSIKSNVFEYI